MNALRMFPYKYTGSTWGLGRFPWQGAQAAEPSSLSPPWNCWITGFIWPAGSGSRNIRSLIKYASSHPCVYSLQCDLPSPMPLWTSNFQCVLRHCQTSGRTWSTLRGFKTILSYQSLVQRTVWNRRTLETSNQWDLNRPKNQTNVIMHGFTMPSSTLSFRSIFLELKGLKKNLSRCPRIFGPYRLRPRTWTM